ncbi:SPFH domain / Band 7 family protein [Tenacibaculum sp. MAR_2009_124]|uniref:SPFH domain-containing protein n=1 Tax=Tenacibaculum sp. MAR_2009_124 TaxID=1250059 RepID=UPI000898B274|nr:SPFH domain-containing protein [Tenacibaculum sp. MAR_2009_124]SEC88902.1 SPFH domain / Band 7 family protein [Tenacibaculum sp. MAR_2009_124]
MEQINIINIVWLIVGGLTSMIFLFTLITVLFYKKPTQGQALIRTGLGNTVIVFDKGIYVIPFLHKLDVLDTTIKRIELKLIDKSNLLCKDGKRIDIVATFLLKVNCSKESIEHTLHSIGSEKASNIENVQEIFSPIFLESIHNIAKKFNFETLRDSISEFKNEIVQHIGRDLYGFSLEQCSINYMEKINLTQEMQKHTQSYN